MLSFLDFNLQTIALFFSAHQHSASIIIYLITLIESIVVIGMFFPGIIAMPAMGFLIGSAIIPAGSTIVSAILGALTGDCLSYLIGVYFHDRIDKIWPFTKWPALLNRSKSFFHHHGGKSIFIGRYVGPIRVFIPIVAGMLKMSFPRFLFATIFSITIWTLTYIVPGILLGALSLELPPKIATEFTIGFLLAIVLLWLGAWIVRHFFVQICQIVDQYTLPLWRYLRNHKKLSIITKFLSDPKEPDNHQQLILVVVASFAGILFLWTLQQTLESGFLVELGKIIYHLLRSLRSENLDYLFMLITFCGDLKTILIMSGIMWLWLLWKRQWYIATHLFIIMALSGGAITFLKLSMYSPRPGDILYNMYESSFPSAHAMLSITFYGFLATVAARKLPTSKKYLAYLGVEVLVGLLAFSRLYLGAHWLIDVLSGILIGLAILLTVTISYHRRHITHFNLREFSLTCITVFVLVWASYSAIAFQKQVKAYALIWPHKTVKFDNLIRGERRALPWYRLNRLGRPIAAFNIVYAGNLTTIANSLQQKGWEPQLSNLDFQTTIRNFYTTSIVNHLPIFPQLYHNKKAALILTKKITSPHEEILILRLWPSDIDLIKNELPIWIGTIECHPTVPTAFSFKSLISHHHATSNTEFLAQQLKTEDFHMWKKHYRLEQQPEEMRQLHWDGKLLIIKSRLDL